jgi:hypothetical protein
MREMDQDRTRKMQGARLRQCRLAAGFESARAAALAHQWPESTYSAHERGTRTIGQDDAEKYARRFSVGGRRVTAREILFGNNETGMTVPLAGFVGAGATMTLYTEAQGPFDEIAAPEGSTEKTVAVEIRGESLGSFFDRWLVFYDDVRDPPTRDLLGRLCVVGLADGRILIKKLERGSEKGLFTLVSQFESPLFDQPVEWAAKVKNMVPR